MHVSKPHSGRSLTPVVVLLTATIVLLFLGGAAEILIVAALLSYVLDPVVTMVEARGLSRTLAVIVVMGGIFLILVLLGVWLVPLVSAQIQTLQAGGQSQQTAESLLQMQASVRELLAPLGMGDVDLLSKIGEIKRSLAESAVNFLLSDFIDLVTTVVMIPFMMFFLLRDSREFKKKLVALVPNRYFEFTMDLLYKMDVQLGNYLRSQFLDAMAFGAMATVAMWIIDVPYFLFIGAFASLANLIPYVGPIAGVIPAFIASVTHTGSIASGVNVIIAYFVVKLVEDFFVQPYIVSKGVELHPLIILVAIIVGGGLFGILGMLLVVPVVGFAKVAFRESLDTYRKYHFS